MCNSAGRPDTRSPTSCKWRWYTCSRLANCPQVGQGRWLALRSSLRILGLGRSSIRRYSVSGLYSPGPCFVIGLTTVALDFILPVYCKSLVSRIAPSVNLLQCQINTYLMWLSNKGQQTIIYRIGEVLWKQEYSLNYQTIVVTKAHRHLVNFRQALCLPSVMRFRR